MFYKLAFLHLCFYRSMINVGNFYFFFSKYSFSFLVFEHPIQTLLKIVWALEKIAILSNSMHR